VVILSRLFRYVTKQTDIVVDIGAHKGYFSVFASYEAKKGKVFAFEPFKKNYDALNANIRLNKRKNIKAYNLGIAGSKKNIVLYANAGNAGGMSVVADWFKKEKNVESHKISCISLQDVFSLCKIKQIDYLKVDCEGGEYDILLNAKPATMKKVHKIGMEFHQIGKLKVGLLEKFLKQNGYRIRIYNHENIIGLLYAER
jgi:FkbM family methyltransferase